MNVALLRYLLSKIKNPREVLLLWTKALDPNPHFPTALRKVYENHKDEILDCVLASHPDLDFKEVEPMVSPNVREALPNLMEEKFCISPLADYVYLVWAEVFLTAKPKEAKVLEAKQKILSFWSAVQF